MLEHFVSLIETTCMPWSSDKVEHALGMIVGIVIVSLHLESIAIKPNAQLQLINKRCVVSEGLSGERRHSGC